MFKPCYILWLQGNILGVVLRQSAEDSGALLGLDICLDSSCGMFRRQEPHAHLSDRLFGPPQPYGHDCEGVLRGSFFAIGELPHFGTIRWEHYTEGDPDRIIRFQPQQLLI